ncbi:MAG: asparagine synthase (glutamine-hydrolyzing) [Candidatus Omnitrophota bacterium]|nr:asparagine synthase (glutamine-hydrolyzing) [Candidatus Omnitrophota bacterium]
MCGIVGYFTPDPKQADGSFLAAMNETLVHRGPDASGLLRRPHAGLAMRRLKVIDLETGDQPISSESGSCHIVFNGEIYNFRELRDRLEKKGHHFRTRSDTEVLLHAYVEKREKCLDDLNGMFAFAVYDEKDKSLFVARDRLGIKPLFYAETDKGLVFASELKAFLACPWISCELDLQALSHFLSLNYLPPPWTPLKGIRQLLPGHWMRVQADKVEVKSYWEIPLEENRDISEREAVTEITRLLHRSIERQLIADVPVGAFLSGGMDSSTLVALIKEHRHDKIKTFSVGFEDPVYDETPYAREVAKYFGTEHYEMLCKPEDVSRSLSRIAFQADNLLADQAALPLYHVSQLAKQHVTVALSGDGGDELFVGYPTFHADHYHSLYTRLPRFLRKNVIEAGIRALPASTGKLSWDYRAKKFIQAGDMSREKAHYWWRTIFTTDEKESILTEAAWRAIPDKDAFGLYAEYFNRSTGSSFVNRALYADQKVWLPGNNLCKVDTMSMAHGLEARVPFLDHELVETVARLPAEMKFRGRILKYLLKKAMKGRLPESIIKRRKAGWHMPIAGWLRGPMAGYAQDLLLQQKTPVHGLFKQDALAALIREHRVGRHNHAFKIWGLLVLNHWSGQFLSKQQVGQAVSAS